MDECIEIVRRNDEAVTLQHAAPPAKQQVTTQTVLQRTCEVLVEYRVEVVVVSAWIVVELRCKARIRVIDTFRTAHNAQTCSKTTTMTGWLGFNDNNGTNRRYRCS